MRICIKCNTSKDIDQYYKRTDRGVTKYRNDCKDCTKKKVLENHSANREYRLNKMREWWNTNIIRERKRRREWQKANKGYVNAYAMKRNAAKLQATPKWLTDEQIKEMIKIYDNCPPGYHVDHIVPLKGVEVRGLHVPWNLQYLTAEDNRRKTNKLILEAK